MPTYEYMCNHCNSSFECVQSMKDDVGASCSKCNTWSSTRLVSGGTGFVLKGSGWAADNYGSSAKSDKKS